MRFAIILITLAAVICPGCTGAEKIESLPDPFAGLEVKTAEQIYREADYFAMVEGSGYLSDDEFVNFQLSGFLIEYGKKYYVLTAGHVKKPGTRVNYPLRVTLGSERNRYYHADILAVDNDYDIAILEIHSDVFDFRGNIGRLGNSDLVKIDDPVTSLGHPPGKTWHLSTGKVLKMNYRNRKNLAKHIQHSCWGGFGSSGGPLLNQYGQIVGMNVTMRVKTIGDTTSDRINALPAKYIRQFLDKKLAEIPKIK